MSEKDQNLVKTRGWIDEDPIETQEWLDALDAVIKNQGEERAVFLLKQLVDQAYDYDLSPPRAITTPVSYTHLTLPTICSV